MSSLRNMAAKSVGGQEIARDTLGMRWEAVDTTDAKKAHWRYLDQNDRIVAVIVEDDAIFKPVYETYMTLGQYSTLEGAERATELWHIQILETLERNGTATEAMGQSDWLTIAESVVESAVKKIKYGRRDSAKEEE